jgi:alcohol dehydrogenase class IV
MMTMMSFYVPTRIILGRGCIRAHSALFRTLGKRAIIVTGKRSAKMNGSERDVKKALEQHQVSFVIFDGVESNPSVLHCREAAELAKRESVDFVVGIGGGSPLDAAKVTAVLATNGIDDETLFSNAFSGSPLPVVAVPTTAGTGSEVTPYAIMTNNKIRSKSTVVNDAIFPKVAFLDAAYTESLPGSVTIHTALDALSHAVESYLSARATDISSFIALESMRVMGACLPHLRDSQAIDMKVRDKLLYASLLGGVAIAHTATTALHAMGYSLTYFKNIDHGRANGLLLGEYLKYIFTLDAGKVKTVVEALDFKNIEDLGDIIDELLGERETISEQEIDIFSSIAMKARNIPFTLRTPVKEELEAMLRRSLSQQGPKK